MIYETIGVDKERFECDVEIFHNVVIVTQTPKSRVGIILNAEILANEICNKFRVPTNQLVWLEAIPEEEQGEGTGYFLVMFTVKDWHCSSPRRIPVNAEIVESFKKYGDEWAKLIQTNEQNK